MMWVSDRLTPKQQILAAMERTGVVNKAMLDFSRRPTDNFEGDIDWAMYAAELARRGNAAVDALEQQLDLVRQHPEVVVDDEAIAMAKAGMERLIATIQQEADSLEVAANKIFRANGLPPIGDAGHD